MSAKKIVSARTVLLLLGAVLISLSLAVPSFATKGQQVEVEGYALIVDGKKDIARENAINNAFRRAVEQVVGVMVESETMVKNFELLNDKVYAKSAGYIKQYTIVGETVQGEELRLRMRALVSVRRVGKDLDDIGLLIKEVGKPRLLLLISEQNGLSESPSYWWGGNGGGIGVVENTILSKFMEKGFSFVDHQVILRALKQDVTAADHLGPVLGNEAALRLAADGEAEVAIIGQAVAKAGPPLMGTTIRSCQANISMRAVNADTGEALASHTTSAVVAHVDAMTGGSEALKKASEEMAEALMSQILAKWKKRMTSTHTVKLIISGLQFDDLKGFKSFLKDNSDSIEEIYDRSYADGLTKLDIEVYGSTVAIAEELSAIKFKGAPVEVTSFTGNVIELIIKTRN